MRVLEKVLSLIPDKKTRDLASTASGMLLVLGGRKGVGLGLFAKGLYGLEKHWQEQNHFEGDLKERWERAIRFYEETHQHPVNRKLHIVGIPIILGGTAGLLLFRPYRPAWILSAGAFAFGWALNFIGHGLFEKNAPAFADDPLSFVAGPVWDWQQLKKNKKNKGKEEAAKEADALGVNVAPADPAVA